MNISMPVLALVALAAGTTLSAVADPAAPVSVVVNGAAASFDQPPVERAGRIFVPLRGVFERLGASVVFANGQINATSGRHTIALSIGSTSALVDGRQTFIDSPPFLIGARTLVPLRFISQALGASVNFDENAQTAYVTQAAPAQASIAPRPLPPPGPVALRLIRDEPGDHTAIDRARPEISTTFGVPVRPDSVRIRLDGRDVTSDAYVSESSFVFEPAYDIPSGPHVVDVSGRIAEGRPFAASWTFASNPVENPNFIRGLFPANGTHIGRTFAVRGQTLPNARVHLVATTNVTVERFSDEASQGVQIVDVTADGNGFFEGDFSLGDEPAYAVDVRVTSSAPDASVAVRTLRLRP